MHLVRHPHKASTPWLNRDKVSPLADVGKCVGILAIVHRLAKVHGLDLFEHLKESVASGPEPLCLRSHLSGLVWQGPCLALVNNSGLLPAVIGRPAIYLIEVCDSCSDRLAGGEPGLDGLPEPCVCLLNAVNVSLRLDGLCCHRDRLLHLHLSTPS